MCMKTSYIFLSIFIGIGSILYAGDADQLNLADPRTIVSSGISRSLIMIDARVADKKENPVLGLKAEDFNLYQDGRQQKITEFHELGLDGGSAEQRIIVFIIDDFGLKPEKYPQIRSAIGYFVDNIMRPNDIVALARTAGGGAVFQPLTPDTDELKTSLDRWQWSVGAVKPGDDDVRGILISEPTFIPSCSGSG